MKNSKILLLALLFPAALQAQEPLTLEDCIESLIGAEITDESDLVADMQEMARRRAQRRQTWQATLNPAGDPESKPDSQ